MITLTKIYTISNFVSLSDICKFMLQEWRTLIRSHNNDGYIWNCNGPDCNRSRKSIRDGSYLGGGTAKMPLTSICSTLYTFSAYMSQVMAESLLDNVASKGTISVWFNFYRELLSWDMITHPVMLGGRGVEVKVDESFFSGKRKYHRGRMLPGVPDPWVLGLLDTTTQKVVMLNVPDRSADTMIPLIQAYVAPHTIITTDGWAAYGRLA